MIAFRQHVKDWVDCRRCPLWETRARVVLARGSIPADVLFVGEAPGESEDTIGQPFVGPAGGHPRWGLDRVIRNTVEAAGLRWAITNLVACIPLYEDYFEGRQKDAPTQESIRRCAPRLKEFVRMVRPQLIVCVGVPARRHVKEQAMFCNKGENQLPWIAEGGFLAFSEIIHPAAILRMQTVVAKDQAVLRSEAVLRGAIRNHFAARVE